MSNTASPAGTSRTTMALGISVLAVVIFIAAMLFAQERNDWLWPLAGVVGGIGAIMGWMAGRKGQAMVALVLGALVFLAVFGWWLVEALSG